MYFRKLVLSILCFSTWSAQAAERYLIKMPGPKLALAKSFQSMGPGKIQFTLDLGQPLTKGKLSYDLVKETLEKRLKKFDAKVSGGNDKVIVTYSGEESAILKKIAKVWIKERKSGNTIALESSVSSGGVRARTAARDPSPNEVKGQVLAVNGSSLKVMINKKGGKGLTNKVPSYPITVIAEGYQARKGQSIFFEPTSFEGKVWQGKNFKNE